MNNNRQFLASKYLSAGRYNAVGNRPANFNAMGRQNVAVARHNALGLQTGFGNPSMAYAAAGGGNQAPNVAPLFGIQVTNSSTSAVSNFDILGAYANMGQSPTVAGQAGSWSSGNLTYSGVTISTLFSTLTYQQFLTSTPTQQFKVGGIYLQVTTGSNQMAYDQFTVQTGSQSGATQSLPIKPFLSPNQYQAGVTMNYCSFIVDGFTKLVWNTLYASTTIQISFFPETTINASAALNGGGVVGSYNQAPIGQ